MKKLLSTSYTDWAFNTALFVLRVTAGVLTLPYGYDKLVHFAQKKDVFMNFLGIGSTLSLSLVIFAEFFCAIFVIAGLFTRFAVLPLVISMGVALFKAHHTDFFGAGEKSALYFVIFLAILLVGPGRASVDAMTGR